MGSDEGLKKLRKRMNVLALTDKHNAAGNNILCNSNAALVNPEYTDKQKKQISDALKVKVVPAKIAGLEIVGSMAAVTDKGALVSPDISEEDRALCDHLLPIFLQKDPL